MTDVSLRVTEAIAKRFPAAVSKTLDADARKKALALYHHLLNPLIDYERKRGTGFVIGSITSILAMAVVTSKWRRIDWITTDPNMQIVATVVAIILVGILGGLIGRRIAGSDNSVFAQEKRSELLSLIEGCGEELELLQHIRANDPSPQYRKLIADAEGEVIEKGV